MQNRRSLESRTRNDQCPQVYSGALKVGLAGCTIIEPLLQIEPPGLNFRAIGSVLVLVFLFQYPRIRI